MSAATAVTVFIGAAIFDGDRLHEDAALVVEDGRITAIVPAAEAPDGARVELDPKTGRFAVQAPERDEEGEVVGWYEDTPEGFGRVAAATARS